MNIRGVAVSVLLLNVPSCVEGFLSANPGRGIDGPSSGRTGLKVSPQEWASLLPTDLPEASAALAAVAQNLPAALEEAGFEASQAPAVVGAGVAASTLPYLAKVANA